MTKAIRSFTLATTPHLHFGEGKLSLLPTAVSAVGKKMLLVTGARSFAAAPYTPALLRQLREKSIAVEQYPIVSEPSPEMIDTAVRQFAGWCPDTVVAIGGGSVLDAGKAISAMLPLNVPVKDYLEGVGTKTHPGDKIYFVAVPTTSGTGSEATKNAVLSETGDQGYKRSLRHDNFVPDLAIVDPSLTISCPPSTTAASGMDAFTQLLESYVSTAANPITDALAYEGLKHIARSLKHAFRNGTDLQARTDLALAAFLSGITLASAGLGLVHGFASPIGGYFEIPHGIICSTLMAPANRATVRRLRQDKTNPEALTKYSLVGKLFADSDNRSEEYYTDFLLQQIETLTETLHIPKLSEYGITAADHARIIKGTDNKNNPAVLGQEEMMAVLEMAM